MDRVILHIDMDAFFASVEIKDNNSLRGKPVIVGGTTERGVVSTCSYEARKYGVRSAMPVFIARELCPNGIFVPVRMSRYKEISNRIFKIFSDVTDIIEPLSIDEAYLDISHINDNPMNIAMYIKRRVYKELGLTLSIGISYNKFLAKIASEWNKPNGIKVITKDMIPNVLFPLDVGKVYGLGKKAVEKLNNIGIFSVKDLYDLDRDYMIEYLGNSAVDIYNKIRGIDNREVAVSSIRKSYGRETTLSNNTIEKSELLNYIRFFTNQITNNLQRDNIKIKTITIKLKSASFENHTRSKTIDKYTDSFEEIFATASDLLMNTEINVPIRLIGVSVSSIEQKKRVEQIMFDI